VIVFILEGTQGVDQFYKNRVSEEQNIRSARFWRARGDILKTCVRDRLARYKNRNDGYLTKVINQLEAMFRADPDDPVTAKACRQAFSTSVNLDRYLFKGSNDMIIGGPETRKPLEKLYVLLQLNFELTL